MMDVVMGVGLALYLGGLVGVLYARGRMATLASVVLLVLGVVLYFGPLLGVGLALSIGGLVGVLYAKGRMATLASVVLLVLGVVVYFGDL